MKADKTLVAGAAATVQKTLDMAPIFKGVAQLQMQQQEFMSSISAAQFLLSSEI